MVRNEESRVSTTSRRHRGYIGLAEDYDRVGALQFAVLALLGLREHHKILDIGCGSLRVGRLLIPFLHKEHYFGIEPNEWLVRNGIEQELGSSIAEAKRPRFSQDRQFRLSEFGVRFDFILAVSIFSHAPRTAIGMALR